LAFEKEILTVFRTFGGRKEWVQTSKVAIIHRFLIKGKAFLKSSLFCRGTSSNAPSLTSIVTLCAKEKPTIFMQLEFVGFSFAQSVTIEVKDGALDDVPATEQATLQKRLALYQEAMNDRDLGRLYPLLPPSKRSEYGQDFFSKANFNTLGLTTRITINEAYLDSVRPKDLRPLPAKNGLFEDVHR